MQSTLHDLKALALSYHPLIVFETVEERRVSSLVRALAHELNLPQLDWSVTQGVCRPGTDPIDGTDDPEKLMDYLLSMQLEVIAHLKDFAVHLEKPRVARGFREVVSHYARNHSTIVLSGGSVTLPDDVDHQAVHVHLRMPNRDELLQLIKVVTTSMKEKHRIDVSLSADDSSALVEALAGLTIDQARQILAWVIVEDLRLGGDDIARVLERKAKLVQESSVLEYYPAGTNRHEIGGFGRLKKWLERARLGFSPAAARMNLDPPKGILMVGVQGCGKSLAAKVIAREWGIPLLRLDAGRLYDKYIGESERNFREATRMAESMAPVVLWIDEIEKAFGSGAASTEDGGLSARLFGMLLTWLQEKKPGVFMVGTANNLERLPPELLRKGRFDEIFFVDLPVEGERAEIFRIHLRARNQDPDGFDIARLASATDGWSGAEIEQAVISSLYESLHRGETLGTSIILHEIGQTTPLSHSRAEAIQRVRSEAAGRFVPVR
ncbi:MAG: AAA family ATPase [Acidobacteria bacterium]|nr:AAA family ATPase [Acidobacteriota bacterium]